MEFRAVFIVSCFLFLGFAVSGGRAVDAEKFKNAKKRLAFMKVPGTEGYIPIFVNDLAGAGAGTSYNYKAPKKGYVYPKPSNTTPLPPLAEFTPDEDLEKELDENPAGVSPDREAELPERPPAIGLETEEDIQSTGISPDRFPDGVRDTPNYELNPDGKPCTSSMNCIYGDTIPGTEGVDYPIYGSVPKTNFKCPSLSGYYGDVKARCQAFHVCLNMRRQVRHYSFLCPNGTIFSQMDFVCVWWHDFNCDTTPALYHLNKQLRWDDATLTLAQKMENLKSMSNLGDDARPNAMNFPQQLLPALTIRLPSTKQSYGLLQSANSLQVSKAGQSRTKTRATVYSSASEAYEEKNASGFIVNRGPGRSTTTTTTTDVPDVFDDPETPATVFLTPDENEENLEPGGAYLPPTSPEPTYLPPKVRTTTPTYVPPRVVTTTPPSVYLPPADTPDENESNELGNVRPEIDYVTTTNPPITRKPVTTTTREPPKLNYLPPAPEYLPPSPAKSASGYSPAVGFEDPAFSMFIRPQKTGDGFPKGYSTPIVRDQEKSFSAKQGQVVENQFDGVAFFVPTETFSGQGLGGVTNLQKDLLQNGLIPIDGPVQPIRAVSYSVPPAPIPATSGQPQAESRAYNEGRNQPQKRQFSAEQLNGYNVAQAAYPQQQEQALAQVYAQQRPSAPAYQQQQHSPQAGYPQYVEQEQNPQPAGQPPRQGNQYQAPTAFSVQAPQLDDQEEDIQAAGIDLRPGARQQVRPSATTYQTRPQVRQRAPQVQRRPQPQGTSLASLLGPLLTATVEGPVKSVELKKPSSTLPPLQTTPRPQLLRLRSTLPPSRPPPYKPEPIRTVEFVDADQGLDAIGQLDTPEPLPSQELKINLKTPVPTPPHIPESYEPFQETQFDDGDVTREIPATFPQQLKDLLLPEVSEPPEIFKSDNIFAQTYISQEGAPIKSLGSNAPDQTFVMVPYAQASPSYTPQPSATYTPQPSATYTPQSSRPYTPKQAYHQTKTYRLPLRFVKSPYRHAKPLRPLYQRRPPQPPRMRNKQKSISLT